MNSDLPKIQSKKWLGPSQELLCLIKETLDKKGYDVTMLEENFNTLQQCGNVSRITLKKEPKTLFYVKILTCQELWFWLSYDKFIRKIQHSHHGFGLPKYVQHEQFRNSYALFPDYGCTLFEYIDSFTIPLDEITYRDLFCWVKPFLSVLKNLHEFGWIHCDIKPSNICFLESKIKLIDFGLSMPIQKPRNYADANKEYPYLAPELYDQKLCQVSTKVDIFSLGMTLLNLCFYLAAKKNINSSDPKSSKHHVTKSNLIEFFTIQDKTIPLFFIIEKMIQENVSQRWSLKEIENYF